MNLQRFCYCPKCGDSLTYVEKKGRSRLNCQACGYIYYENPVVGVAGILMNKAGQILLGRRRSGLYKGLWCIPCGYLEYDEDIHTGIQREFKEETNLDVEVREIFSAQSNFHDPDRHSVGIWYLVRAVAGEMQAGDDLDAVLFFDLDQLPEMAFSTDHTVIQLLRAQIFVPFA